MTGIGSVSLQKFPTLAVRHWLLVFKIVSMAQIRKILLCRCTCGKALPADAVGQAIASLGGDCPQGELTVVDDMCELAQRQDPTLAALLESDHLTVLACAPRAVRWLLAKCSPAADPSRLQLLDLREDSSVAISAMRPTGVSPVSCAAAVPAARQGGVSPAVASSSSSSAAADEHAISGQALEAGHAQSPDAPGKRWMPWFPVIDYDRCVNCLQCVSFCLFGVYQKGDDGKITVARPHKCKTYCPACSRVCPRGAIMFPKHPQATINGREIPKRTDTSNSPTQPNVLEGLVKGDVYETLRRRQDGGAASGDPAKANPADAAIPVSDEIPSAMLEAMVQKHMQRLHDAKPDQEQR